MTIAPLEQYNPNILSSGRLCELSDNYKVDVTQTVCRTFEGLLRGVENEKFAMDLMQLRLESEHREMMAKVKRDLTTMAIPQLERIRNSMDAHIDALGEVADEEATANMPKVALVSSSIPWVPPTQEDTDSFEAIFQMPERRHPLRALKKKVHSAMKSLKDYAWEWK
jgi:hypothetical protein